MCAPCVRISEAMTPPMRRMSSGFHVEACPSAVGKTVAPMAMNPWGASSARKSGMPQRLCSMA